jgi:superfamily II DNA or RNA helicase
MNLRPYQEQAVLAVEACLAKGEDPLVVLPTGTGKTTVFSELVRRELARNARLGSGASIVVMAHRRELVTQAASRIASWAMVDVAIEMAEQRATPGRDPVICASVDSLALRLDAYPPGSVSLLIVDEAHHAAASRYRAVARQFGCPVVGVTATPERSDREALAFSTVAFQYDILTAIADGYLVPVESISLDVALNVAAIGEGDISDEAAAVALSESVGAWSKGLAQAAGQRPTVVFMPSVALVFECVEILRSLGLAAEGASAQTPVAEREAILRRYAHRQTQFIVNCGLWTEGWDAPHTECVAIGRVTKNRTLYAQMMGRGLRPSPGKTHCLVIDIAGSGEGLGLADVTAVLCGSWGNEVAETARKRAREGQSQVAAARDAIEEAKRKAQELEAAQRSSLAAKREFDVFDTKRKRPPKPVTADDIGLEVPQGDSRKPTEKQLALLTKYGFAHPTSFAEASALVDWLVRRFKAKLCMPRQARVLHRYALPVDVSAAQAGQWIAAIASNGWRRPHGLPFADRTTSPR